MQLEASLSTGSFAQKQNPHEFLQAAPLWDVASILIELQSEEYGNRRWRHLPTWLGLREALLPVQGIKSADDLMVLLLLKLLSGSHSAPLRCKYAITD